MDSFARFGMKGWEGSEDTLRARIAGGATARVA
jgi:hypothetical protein